MSCCQNVRTACENVVNTAAVFLDIAAAKEPNVHRTQPVTSALLLDDCDPNIGPPTMNAHRCGWCIWGRRGRSKLRRQCLLRIHSHQFGHHYHNRPLDRNRFGESRTSMIQGFELANKSHTVDTKCLSYMLPRASSSVEIRRSYRPHPPLHMYSFRC